MYLSWTYGIFVAKLKKNYLDSNYLHVMFLHDMGDYGSPQLLILCQF